MKVKVFVSGSTSVFDHAAEKVQRLEKEVNDWLAVNSGITVQQFYVAPFSHEMVATLVYSE